VELAGVTFPEGTVDSRASARAALANGSITYGHFRNGDDPDRG
jgi:hypothetical protein